jgi:hypothetical protein
MKDSSSKLLNSSEREKLNYKLTKILIKKLRIHFIFSESIESMQFFLENTEVEFRITDGPSWNKPLAVASAFPFTHF